MSAHNRFTQSLGQRVKDILIDSLRDYFQNISQFGFPGSSIAMPIIREAYSQDLRSWPAIFIKITHVAENPMSIGQDFVKDVWSDDQTTFDKYLPHTENFENPVSYRPRVIAERYGRMADVSINIQVWGDTVPVRNKVVDEVLAALWRYERQSLLDEGIILSSLSEGEETDFPINDTEQMYIANINLTVNAELYIDVPVQSVTAVNVRNNKA